MSKKGTQTLKANLRKLAKDDRLHPNRRLLAVLLLGVLEGHTFFLDIIQEQYGKASKVRWTENMEGFQESLQSNVINDNAQEQLKKLFEVIGGNDGEDGNSSTSG